MRRTDQSWLIAQILGGVFIWGHDRSWLANLDDSLPLLATLPLFVWLGAPWKFSDATFAPRPSALILAGAASILGLLLGLNVLLAIGWTAALWAWLGTRLESAGRDRVRRLLPLAVLAFPWLTLDFPVLAWWFRLASAWSAEHFFQALGLGVQREGTGLLVAHMPFDVTPACSGIKALQSILVAGTALCFLQTSHRRLYWIGLIALPFIAFFANAARVIMIVGTALSIGPEFAEGWFHAFGGWLVILLICGAMWFGLNHLGRRLKGGIA